MTALDVNHFIGQETLQEVCNAAENIDKAKLPDSGMGTGK